MAKRELLRLPGTFEQALYDLLQTPPARKLPTAKQQDAVKQVQADKTPAKKKRTRKKGR